MPLSRVPGWVLLAAVGLAGCGGGDAPATPATLSHGSAAHRSELPVASCARPAARESIRSDLQPQDDSTSASIGPVSLVIGPSRVAPGRVAASKATVTVEGRRAVTLTVEPSSRRRFSLLFAGAGTGGAETGFRVADGVPAVRFPACGRRATTFLGGVLVRGGGCVHLHASGALAERSAPGRAEYPQRESNSRYEVENLAC
jgi:hypothetical protein